MLHTGFTLSDHAEIRMSQRNCSRSDVEYALNHGKRVHSAGVTTFFLGKRDIPQSDQKLSKISRLEGITVLAKAMENGILQIITVYRNRTAIKAARRKSKYDLKKQNSSAKSLLVED
jgi:hypothetical protein